ncbi:hypothetical protein J2752_002859 [Halarchaeum rubridurum]|uniref:Uncharacterized protein n=1 Tax=Halarchaeum rubridurum TaxID=489911 RepID=A0A830G4N9_9EURY|nr:hypothetical protein [Halarchaeum rubridurum]MBP1955928.1 hypothetical protein [Halarchaeum rubridurum]GGM75439.1 hypothetical protein GCM10009017_26750 [Halarchaeum rubridurum]
MGALEELARLLLERVVDVEDARDPLHFPEAVAQVSLLFGTEPPTLLLAT